MNEKNINKAAKFLGRRGGLANIEKHGADRMREIGRLGGLRKKANEDKAKSTYQQPDLHQPLASDIVGSDR